HQRHGKSYGRWKHRMIQPYRRPHLNSRNLPTCMSQRTLGTVWNGLEERTMWRRSKTMGNHML
ncbi:hypothetical protein LTR16_012665, partial [Cryomyces antarcticus]